MADDQDKIEDLGPDPFEPGDDLDARADAEEAAAAAGRDPLDAMRLEEALGTARRPLAAGQGPGDVPAPEDEVRQEPDRRSGGGGDGSGSQPAPGQER